MEASSEAPRAKQDANYAEAIDREAERSEAEAVEAMSTQELAQG